MKPPKNYSAPVRAANTHQLIAATKVTSIIERNHSDYIKNFDWIEFENYVITGPVRFQGILAKYKLAFKNCYFEDHVLFHGGEFDDYVSLSDCYFEKGLFIDQCSFKKGFEIYSIHIDHSLTIAGGSFEEFKLRGYFDLKSFWITGGTFKEFLFEKDKEDDELEELTIFNKKTAINGVVRFEGLSVKKIYLNGIYPTSNEFFFKNVNCDHFMFSDFNNNGVLKIFGLEPISKHESYFEVVKSNLGRAQFYRICFDYYEEVVFVDSFMAETNIINCSWGNNFRGIESQIFLNEKQGPSVAESEKKQLKESYRQLKFAYDKQGDKINETIFYSKEMNIYNSLIPWSKVWYKPMSEKFWEKLIILSSRYLSNYGTSFLRPFAGIILGNLFVLIILIHYFNYQGLELAGFSIGEREANTTAIGEFFKLVNPLHKVDEKLKGWEVFWDLISRVSASYFLYNLIRSSRRFIK